jgi:hypothetical protein
MPPRLSSACRIVGCAEQPTAMSFSRKFPLRRAVALALVQALAVAGSGCSESITMEEVFPLPLVEKLPLRVALHYSPALQEYVHSEQSETGLDWTIRLGTANTRMFDAVFSSLFTVTGKVSDRTLAAQEMPGHDIVISPAVDAFELALPSDSGSDYYAVWIRYVLDVYDHDGKLVVRWPVSAYGQSGTGGLSDKESMQRAVLLALRDAEAAIAVGFDRQPAVRERLLKDLSKEDLLNAPPKESPDVAP